MMSKPTLRSNAATAETQPPKPKASVSAAELGAHQREISVSEFFTKNRHLLGFDNPRKALLTCVKEAVDNALDACEAGAIRAAAPSLEGQIDRKKRRPPAIARTTSAVFGPTPGRPMRVRRATYQKGRAS